MKFADLPFEARTAIENYNICGEMADDCLEGLLMIVKDKEGAARVLCEGYGQWYHDREKAREMLESKYNICGAELMRLSLEMGHDEK